ncbi:hypothetical protein [Rhizobium sp. AB2/73]|uniref:hypothetical protein n=1 Tax=Rhizobium sp. AB2/73 TaxID=2795216 RepID=UPI000DDD78F5|nr:hypothetical protein [Rhizobium sp. AB2/73]QYA17378.1 hypothetical protein J5284_34195 [Rhizobium sp. AB2/73]UEQ85697.1 hypothetical protein I8E17_34175 [Rhizobium sp. AB2/73]
MRDDRRIIVNPETDHKSEQGWAKVSGTIFIAVMVIGVIDHALTVAWHWAQTWWDGILSFFTF